MQHPPDTLTGAYATAFSTIQVRFGAIGGVSARDKGHIRDIQDNAAYRLGKPSQCTYVQQKPLFEATPYETKAYADILPFIACHEIHHILCAKRFYAGGYNTKAVKVLYPNVIGATAQKVNDLCQNFDFDPDTAENVSEKEAIQRDFWSWSTLSDSLAKEFNKAYLDEEYACDSFALDVFPDTDLTRFEQFLYDNTIDLTAEIQAVTSDFNSHPSNRSRLARLRQKKRF